MSEKTATELDVKWCFAGTALIILIAMVGIIHTILLSRDHIINELKQPCTEAR